MRRIFLAAIAVLAGWSARASEPTDSLSHPINADQQHIEDLKHSQRLVFYGDDSVKVRQDSIRSLIDRFYVDQYRHFQDPEAPYFLLLSKDATLAMGIGGAVRMRGFLDFDGSVPYSGFIPYTMPVPENPAMRRRLDATPSGTALFFRIIGTNKTLGNFSAFIQGSFDGGTGREFKIKKSYVTINDVTIGYTTSSFSDIAANPPVIDAQGPNGQVNNTSVLVQWRHPIKRWTIAASVEFPQSYIMADNKTTAALKDYVPDVVAYGQYGWAGGAGHVRLSGLMRWLPYRNLISGTNHSKPGYGVQLSGVIPVDYNWTVYAEAVGGNGCESYINDFMVTSLDLMPDPETPGKMYAPWCYGLTAGVRYYFLPNLFASVSGSKAYLKPKAGESAEQYKYGLYGVANVIWNMSPRLQVGAEYLMGKRENYNGESGSAKRINLLFQFSF
ncbi:MAG: hypothetical protein K2K37_02245 [Muribaculaceae bacterium]|nr:hypothetical protein [Muribaculaceae bacterium]